MEHPRSPEDSIRRAHLSGFPGAGLRVCHLGKYYPPAPGGIESHVQTLARAQSDLGANVSVVCVNHEDRLGCNVNGRLFAATPTIRAQDGAVRVARLGRRGSLARLDVCPEMILGLDELNPHQSDLVHLHVPNPAMLLALVMARPKLPLFISYHSDIVRQKLLVRLLRPLERIVFARAAWILSDSPMYSHDSTFL